MKYVLPFVILLLIVAGLCQPVVDPQNYTGLWYSADDQTVYLFQNGLIYCKKHAVPISDTDFVSGAYSYCKNSILLFANGVEGLETVKEVFWVQNDDGSFLCENKDGSGEIYFIRYHKDT